MFNAYNVDQTKICVVVDTNGTNQDQTMCIRKQQYHK